MYIYIYIYIYIYVYVNIYINIYSHGLAVTVTQVLDDYRASLHDLLLKNWREMELDHLLAQTNNCARCVECCLQLLEELAGKLPAALCENLDLQAVADGFADLAKVGVELLGNIVSIYIYI